MSKLQHSLARFSPPGSDPSHQLLYMAGAPIFAFLYSLAGYFSNYSRFYYEIIDRSTGKRISPEQMPVFQELLCLEIFPILCAGWIAFVIANYLYFYQESKSVYTMRRLRSSWELHLRCWTLPVLGALVLVLSASLCWYLHGLHYFNATPVELIPAHTLTLWR